MTLIAKHSAYVADEICKDLLPVLLNNQQDISSIDADEV
jgi:hypothetical protein